MFWTNMRENTMFQAMGIALTLSIVRLWQNILAIKVFKI